jgi:hypothetical protein
MHSTRYSFKILIKLTLFQHTFENPQISNFMKIRPVRGELFHTDGRMDEAQDRHDEANGRFSQFCEHAEN